MFKDQERWPERGAAGPAPAVELVARVLERAINREGLKERRDCWVCGQDGDSTAGRKPSALLLYSEMLCEVPAVGGNCDIYDLFHRGTSP